MMKKPAKSPDGESRCKAFKITGLALLKCAKSAHWWKQMSPAFAADLAIWHSCCAAEDGLKEGFSQGFLQQLRCTWDLLPLEILISLITLQKCLRDCVSAPFSLPGCPWINNLQLESLYEEFCSASANRTLLNLWGQVRLQDIYLPSRSKQRRPGGTRLRPSPHLWLQLPMRNGDQRPPSQRTWRAWADHLCGVSHQAALPAHQKQNGPVLVFCKCAHH